MAILLALLVILLIVLGSNLLKVCFPKENAIAEGMPNTIRDDYGLMRPKASLMHKEGNPTNLIEKSMYGNEPRNSDAYGQPNMRPSNISKSYYGGKKDSKI